MKHFADFFSSSPFGSPFVKCFKSQSKVYWTREELEQIAKCFLDAPPGCANVHFELKKNPAISQLRTIHLDDFYKTLQQLFNTVDTLAAYEGSSLELAPRTCTEFLLYPSGNRRGKWPSSSFTKAEAETLGLFRKFGERRAKERCTTLVSLVENKQWGELLPLIEDEEYMKWIVFDFRTWFVAKLCTQNAPVVVLEKLFQVRPDVLRLLGCTEHSLALPDSCFPNTDLVFLLAKSGDPGIIEQLLYHVTRIGDGSNCKSLLQFGAFTPNRMNDWLGRFLMITINLRIPVDIAGRFEVLRHLLQFGANPFRQTRFGDGRTSSLFKKELLLGFLSELGRSGYSGSRYLATTIVTMLAMCSAKIVSNKPGGQHCGLATLPMQLLRMVYVTLIDLENVGHREEPM